jgi:hypothetical protein
MWEARFIGECGCGKCGGHWNVFKQDGTQITNLSEEDAKLIAAALNNRTEISKMFKHLEEINHADAQSRAAEGGANLTDVLERALRLIKDSLPPYARDTGFQEFHISLGNGIVLRDANGTMICAGHRRIAETMVAMRSNA